jgi:hypothetical protein
MKYQVVRQKWLHYDRSSGEKSAVLRKTSNNNYIYKARQNILWLFYCRWKSNPKYDEATDTVTITTYSVGK